MSQRKFTEKHFKILSTISYRMFYCLAPPPNLSSLIFHPDLLTFPNKPTYLAVCLQPPPKNSTFKLSVKMFFWTSYMFRRGQKSEQTPWLRVLSPTWEKYLSPWWRHKGKIFIKSFCIHFLKMGQKQKNNRVNFCHYLKSEFWIILDI